MKLKYCILIVTVLFINRAHAHTGSMVKNYSDTTKWLSYTDTAYQFSFKYPSNWQLKLPNTNTRFFVTSYTENDADNFRENINCIVRKLDEQNFDIKTVETAVKESLAEKLKDFKLLSSGYIKWNNVTALLLDYTATTESNGVTYKIRIRQQMAVLNDNLFTITYTAETASYDKYLPAIKKIIQSLKAE